MGFTAAGGRPRGTASRWEARVDVARLLTPERARGSCPRAPGSLRHDRFRDLSGGGRGPLRCLWVAVPLCPCPQSPQPAGPGALHAPGAGAGLALILPRVGGRGLRPGAWVPALPAGSACLRHGTARHGTAWCGAGQAAPSAAWGGRPELTRWTLWVLVLLSPATFPWMVLEVYLQTEPGDLKSPAPLCASSILRPDADGPRSLRQICWSLQQDAAETPARKPRPFLESDSVARVDARF